MPKLCLEETVGNPRFATNVWNMFTYLWFEFMINVGLVMEDIRLTTC